MPRAILLAVALAISGCATTAAGTGAPAAVPLTVGETYALPSATLRETRRVNVLLPPGYADAPTRRYPVLYLLDGGIDEDFLHIAGLVRVLTVNGSMHPVILVGIGNTQRRRDTTGPTADPEDRAIAPQVGGSAAFRRFLVDELMPDVRARYRSNGDDGLIGESLAGLFVIETFARMPHAFDAYIAVDPSLWWNRGALIDTAPDWLAAQPPDLQARVYIATGREGSAAEGMRRFLGMLEQRAHPGVRVWRQPLTDRSHADVFHPAALLALPQVFPAGEKAE
jgi:predicted alpha/beta superfamily hydrolase